MALLGTLAKAAGEWLFPPGSGAAQVLVRNFFSYADLFAPGMALAVVHASILHFALRLPRWWNSVVVAVLGTSVITVVTLDDRGLLWRWGVANPYQRLTSLACVLLLALVVLPQKGVPDPPFLVRALEWRPLVASGTVSYSLFLWHEPVIRRLQAQGWTSTGRVGFLYNLLLVVAVSGGLASLTYMCVERPALRRKTPGVPATAGGKDRPSPMGRAAAHVTRFASRRARIGATSEQ